MSNESTVDFKVWAKSRFENSFAAYDPKSHKYHPEYVNPRTRRILLEIKNSKNLEDIVFYEWRIQRKGSDQVLRHTGSRQEEMQQVGFNVPALGEYDCQLNVRLRNGKSLSKTKRFNLRSDFLIVAIGDSYASGEGNPDKHGKPASFDPGVSGWDILDPRNWDDIVVAALDWGWNHLKQEFATLSSMAGASIDMKPEPVWLEEKAHRSLRSGIALAAADFESFSQGELVTFLSYARSGAEIKAGLIGPRTKDGKPVDSWIDNIGQIDEVKEAVGKQRIDALIISIGGNDIGFASRLEDLVAGDNFSNYLFFGTGDDTQNRERAKARVTEDLKLLESKFAELATALEELNVDRVFLTEYPTGLFDNQQKQPAEGCGIFKSNFDADITAADAQVIRDAAAALNRLLAKVAQTHGWVFVNGIAEEFAGHGYCTGRSTYFVSAEQSLAIQGDTDGVMHPNSSGHHVIAIQIGKALRILKSHQGKPRTEKGKPRSQIRPTNAEVIDHRSG